MLSPDRLVELMVPRSIVAGKQDGWERGKGKGGKGEEGRRDGEKEERGSIKGDLPPPTKGGGRP